MSHICIVPVTTVLDLPMNPEQCRLVNQTTLQYINKSSVLQPDGEATIENSGHPCILISRHEA
jgi:hypothetical protein